MYSKRQNLTSKTKGIITTDLPLVHACYQPANTGSLQALMVEQIENWTCSLSDVDDKFVHCCLAQRNAPSGPVAPLTDSI